MALAITFVLVRLLCISSSLIVLRLSSVVVWLLYCSTLVIASIAFATFRALVLFLYCNLSVTVSLGVVASIALLAAYVEHNK